MPQVELPTCSSFVIGLIGNAQVEDEVAPIDMTFDGMANVLALTTVEDAAQSVTVGSHEVTVT